MESSDVSEQEKEKQKIQLFINNMFYDEELVNLTYDEKIIKQRLKDIKFAISNFNNSQLIFGKEEILKNDFFLTLIAHSIKADYDPILFTEERLNDLANDYNRVNQCINEDGLDKTLDIVKMYGNIIPKDDNGFYSINDTLIDKVIKDNEFYISDSDDKKALEKEIFNTWENQKEILTQDTLNKYSEARNGLSFKHFIFCEEYLKRGKIKPTCEHLGIARNTAYLWLKDDKVKEYLKSRQDEIKQDYDNMFKNVYNACFNEISDIINNEYTDTSDKIKAINTFLNHYENMQKINTGISNKEDD